MFIRPAILEDIPALKILCRDTIKMIGARGYQEEQVVAWASAAENTESFARRMATQYFYVMMEEDFEKSFIIGFASLEGSKKDTGMNRLRSKDKFNGTSAQTGYLDMLYVHKDFQLRGVATCLLARILETAGELGLTGMVVEASIPARSFFEKHNFRISGEQTVLVNGIALLNYTMRLDLRKG